MTASPLLGSTVGSYRLETHVGHGAMGDVFTARDTKLNRLVALKILAPELADDPSFRTRFQREAHLAGSVQHANVLPIYEAGESDGYLYIVSPFIDGVDLAQLIEKRGTLAPERAVAILLQVASGLDAAHAAGIVHRDVKPANILLTKSGKQTHAYLADFGLARRQLTVAATTQPGVVLGTVDYLAPEQIGGLPVDARTDIYALACVLFQALAGSPPFKRDTMYATAQAHLTEPPPVLSALRPELGPGIDAVIARGLAKSKDGRPSRAGELLDQAAAALEPAIAKYHAQASKRPHVVDPPRPGVNRPARPLDRAIARALRRLIEQHGTSIARDPQRIRGLLLDASGSLRREIDVVTAIAEAGAAAELVAGSVSPTEVSRLSESASKSKGLSADDARWGVDVWLEALTGPAAAPDPDVTIVDPGGPGRPSDGGRTSDPEGARPPPRRRPSPKVLIEVAAVLVAIVLLLILAVRDNGPSDAAGPPGRVTTGPTGSTAAPTGETPPTPAGYDQLVAHIPAAAGSCEPAASDQIGSAYVGATCSASSIGRSYYLYRTLSDLQLAYGSELRTLGVSSGSTRCPTPGSESSYDVSAVAAGRLACLDRPDGSHLYVWTRDELLILSYLVAGPSITPDDGFIAWQASGPVA